MKISYLINACPYNVELGEEGVKARLNVGIRYLSMCILCVIGKSFGITQKHAELFL